VTVDLDSVTLPSALQSIAWEAGLHVFVGENILRHGGRVSLHLRATPVDDAFAKALKGTGLKAKIVEENVAFVSLGESASDSASQGIITGVVTDAVTKQPLQGVLILLDEAKRGITTDNNGAFRFANVSAGSHIVHARKLAYARWSQSFAVTAGESTVAKIALETCVNTLDQVVVTGTVVPTELKAVPNAITIITGKELQDRGVTRIYELFRGDVPGLFVNRIGQVEAINPTGAIGITARGSTNLSAGSRYGIVGEQLKTYVDGVEMANSGYLGMIDPNNIDRIEIITGPQASTIYGSNAINGVMQVFTKRGMSSRPQLTLSLQNSWTQNNLSSALAPNHEAVGDLSGVEGRLNYRVGGDWVSQGSWVPAISTQTMSGSAGARVNLGALTTDASLRWMQSSNRSKGEDQFLVHVRDATGLGGNDYYGTGTGPIPDDNFGKTTDDAVSFSATYTPIPQWSQTLTLGNDATTSFRQQFSRTFSNPSDTGYSMHQDPTQRVTASYSTTVHLTVTTMAAVILTVGADESHSTYESLGGQYLQVPGGQLVSTAPSGWGYSRGQAREHGGFLQSQVGLWDELFLTYGVRAVYNPNIGKAQNPNFEPRYGIAMSHDFGGVTAKLRASYGTATRPPQLGDKDGQQQGALGPYLMQYWGIPFNRLPNPDLVPESQQGGEGGLELYMGNRGSIQVTRYNQTVDNLIIEALIDTVNLLPIWQAQYGSTCCWAHITQKLNIGSVRNEGWEARGTFNLGPFATNGTFSWNKSRLIGITPKYRWQFPQFVVGATFASIPEHTWALGVTYLHGGTRISYNLQGQGIVLATSDATYLDRVGLDYRLNLNKPRMAIPDAYSEVYPGFAIGDLNVSQQFTTRVEGVLQMHNLTNSYKSDIIPTEAQAGRQTGLGLRIRW